jgi:hypothetical protein
MASCALRDGALHHNSSQPPAFQCREIVERMSATRRRLQPVSLAARNGTLRKIGARQAPIIDSDQQYQWRSGSTRSSFGTTALSSRRPGRQSEDGSFLTAAGIRSSRISAGRLKVTRQRHTRRAGSPHVCPPCLTLKQTNVAARQLSHNRNRLAGVAETSSHRWKAFGLCVRARQVQVGLNPRPRSPIPIGRRRREAIPRQSSP